MKHWMFLIMGLTLGLDAPLAQGQDPATNPNAPAPNPPAVELATPQPTTPETPTTPKPVAPDPAAVDPAAAVPATPTPAAPAPAGPTAIVKSNRVNVRGKASLNSEVVTQLNAGDRVTVLEQITLKDPKPDEPEKWVRIAVPNSVPVWVHSSFIDSNTHTVKATQLNMRSGPGENHSILGRISQGTPVMELESKDGWVKINPPDVIHAYVAAYLVTMEPGQAPPAVTLISTPAPASTTNATAATPPLPVEAVTLEPPPVVSADPVAVDLIATTPDAAATPPAIAQDSGPEEDKAPPPPPPKRIVRREGIVRRSVSIQAPSYFVLESLQGRKTINYLHTTNRTMVLQDFYGARIVVTGEELIDERWPNTPVISIDSLEAVP